MSFAHGLKSNLKVFYSHNLVDASTVVYLHINYV